MAAPDRSFSDVMQSIVGNIQDIVRSEVRLAKTEIREEAAKTKTAASLLGGGAAIAVFATLFLLLSIVFAMALFLPLWAAALILGTVLAVAAGALIVTGLKQLKRVHPTPERTVETIKENVAWVKQRTK
jgi:uncharacterized membrane protein YqjE